MKKVLYTIYLKHDLACDSLESSAIAQLIIKILYSQNKNITIDEISRNICKIVGIKIPEDKILKSIEAIKSKISVTQNNGLYKLRDKYRDSLDTIFKGRNDRFDRIVIKYFDSCESSITNIKNWFNDVLIEFFCNFSSDWISKVSNNNRKTNYDNFENILNNKEIFKRNNINNNDKKWLVNQIKKFLTSNEPDESNLMWDYGNSLFAAKLLYSKEYIDKNVIDLFESMTLVLDTNILMRLYLEKDSYSDSYRALENIFEKLNITLIYFYITQEEFNNAINNKIVYIKKVLEDYDYRIDLLSQINDVFIQTAISRDCKNKDDFELFFECIKEIPDVFVEKLPINITDYRELNSIIKKGMDDDKVKMNLNDIFTTNYNHNKNHYNLEHDAGLINGTIYLNKTTKSMILSRDSTIVEYANSHIIRDNLPIVISLDSLLNLFAVNDGFEGVVESSFIPLFANLVKNKVYSRDRFFNIEDLLYLKDIESRIDKLEDDQIIEIASEVNKRKIKGKEDSDIALYIKRTFISYEKNNTLNDKKQKVRKYENKINIIKTNFYDEKRKMFSKKYKNKRNLHFLILSLVFLALLGISYLITRINIENKILGYLTLLSTFVIDLMISLIFVFPRIIKKYKSSTDEMDKNIDKLWKKYNESDK
ncbi:MAG: hypothetical protein ACPKMZ_01950 [Pleomorphochaeta sp.]